MNNSSPPFTAAPGQVLSETRSPFRSVLRFFGIGVTPPVTDLRGMRPHSLSRTRGPQAWSVLLVVMAAVITAMSLLVYPSPYSPLIAAGAAAGIAVLVVFIRHPVWALYAALLLVLIPAGAIQEDVHSLLNRTMTIAALATWLLAVIRDRTRLKWTTASSLVLAFVLWGVVTTGWAGNLLASATLIVLYMLRLTMFLVLIPNEIRTEKELNGLMNVLATCGWILLLVSAVTVLSEGYTPFTRFRPLRANANELGVIALATLPGVFWQALRPWNRYRFARKLMASFFLIGVIFLIALTGSRGTAISLCVTLLAFWFWRSTRLWAKQGMVILAAGILLFPIAFVTTLTRFSGTPNDTALGGREVLWQEAWNAIQENPMTGVGIGNSAYAIRSALGAYGKDERVPIHNPVLVIWVETGIPGLFLYLSAMAAACWSFARQYRRWRLLGVEWPLPYFALVSSVFLGFLFSWVKGGAIESSYAHFLFLSLLVIPSCLEIRTPALVSGHDAFRPGAGRRD